MTNYAQTKRDLPMNLWGADIVIPAGTQVMHIAGHGELWAVASVGLLVELTGNTHDPVYRYAWVPTTKIEEAP